MKIKELRRFAAINFPPELVPVFDACHTVREIEFVCAAARTMAVMVSRVHDKLLVAETTFSCQLESMKGRVEALEEQIRLSGSLAIRVERGGEPQEEVFLVRASESIRENAKFNNRIGLIKAVREVSNMGLMEAKALIEDVIDRGTPRSVFKGSTSKAAVAARVLDAAGGITERKEAF